MFDHEYTLVGHPRLRARVSYRREGDDLGAATVRLDFRRDDDWTEEGLAVELPEHPAESGVEWRGFRIALYRDGEQVLARDTSSGIVSDLGEAVSLAERVAPSLVRKGRQAVKGAARRAGGAGSGPVEMTQLDGTSLEALAPPAKATFEVYEGKDEKWRWRLVHDNGNVIADSGQGYSSKRAAEKGLRSVKRNALGAAIEPVGGEAERDVRSASDTDGDAAGEVGSAES
ncbi:HVO_2922 family protein [Halorussus litoreus]|uniref:HVO_2922 family protein n=1 Tax=Halorussus litoreus TaxID=1710536 RepID=UPI001E53D451|nr:HVO_2922 family protein [Halorussus litoreus]